MPGFMRFRKIQKLLFSFLFSYHLPADPTDAGFETQSAENLLEQHVLPMLVTMA
jgi:hypothetical protein